MHEKTFFGLVTKKLQKAFIFNLPKSVLKVTTLCFQTQRDGKKHLKNKWNENEKFSLKKNTPQAFEKYYKKLMIHELPPNNK